MGLLLDRRRMMCGSADRVIMTSASNPEVMAICYAQGWCASPDRMTQSEAAAVTSIGTAFRSSNIVHFDEFEYFTGVTSTDAWCFANCASLATLRLPASVISLGTYTFYQCYALDCDLDLSHVMTTGFGIFFQCTALRSASLFNFTVIPQLYFNGCTSLASVSLPSGITSIKNAAFERCTALKSVQIPPTVTELANAFQRSGLESISLPNGLTTIGNGEFAFCASLSVLSFPASVTQIGETCAVASGITSLHLPSTLTQIGGYSFGACSKLAEIRSDAMQAPTLISTSGNIMPFANNTGGSVPAADRKLIVPVGSAGYDTGDWLYLQNTLGYTLIYE